MYRRLSGRLSACSQEMPSRAGHRDDMTAGLHPTTAPAQAYEPGRRTPVARTRNGNGPLVLVLASLAIVVALWVGNHGLDQLGAGAGTAASSLGRLTGLLAADLLLVQVLAMARIPWVERRYGQDRLARWHRLLGFSSVTLMLGHVVLITLGYAAQARTGVLAELWDLVVSYPGMLLATSGTVLLVMVAVTSVRAARRRLRYESWHLLHLYAYLGVGLALPHEVWTGSDFIASPWARTYWWSLYGAALVAIVASRLGLPLVLNLRHRLVVARVVPEAPGVVSVHLSGRKLHRLPTVAGQFFVFRFLDGAGWTRGNPYSLSARPHPSMLRITVKDLGDGSQRLAGLRPGTRVLVEGPYGALTAARRTRHHATLLASGIGITPLRALAEDMPPGTTLVYRARSEADLVHRGELESLATHRGLRLVYLLGPRARPGSWLPQDWAHVGDAAALRHLVPGIARSDVFVCGPDAWADAVRTALAEAGVPGQQVHVERFAY
jgi:predicted ferric reductase